MYFRGDYTRLLLERLLTSAMVLVALFQSARLVVKSKKALGIFEEKDSTFWWAVFTITLFLILNAEVAAFFHDYARLARFAAISVLWALFSIVLMIFGFWKNRSSLRKCAIGLFVVTMLKVFLVDMSKVSTPYRVISFMVLGLMLIGASYLYYRFKKQLLPTTSSKEGPKR